jgi:translin
MHQLEGIVERIRKSFDDRTAERDRALTQTRTITRNCAKAIRAIHRNELELAKERLGEASVLVENLHDNLVDYPDLYFTGYTQSALKEYAEANIFLQLVENNHIPEPEELGLVYSTYLQGLAEVVGELRRRCLDNLRHGQSGEAERLLVHMDEIYAELITMDYPDAITGGLRRLTDIVRGITERTRGDITISLRQEQLEHSLKRLEDQLDNLDKK